MRQSSKKVKNARLVSKYVRLSSSPSRSTYVRNHRDGGRSKIFLFRTILIDFCPVLCIIYKDIGVRGTCRQLPQLARTQALGSQCIRGTKRGAGAKLPPSFWHTS